MPVSKNRRKKNQVVQRRPMQQTVKGPRKKTSRWVVPVTFALFGLGTLVIVLNYMGIFGGSTRNELLFVGLGLVASGVLTATKIY